ncbi:hypothetical protein ACI75Y_01925 [Capnocytophaga stomatis]|uniref:hypothetical protein n=1 Tax=Capnocytophaga stomatis TaxID=1848904 RepID=UPI00385A980F
MARSETKIGKKGRKLWFGNFFFSYKPHLTSLSRSESYWAYEPYAVFFGFYIINPT